MDCSPARRRILFGFEAADWLFLAGGVALIKGLGGNLTKLWRSMVPMYPGRVPSHALRGNAFDRVPPG